MPNQDELEKEFKRWKDYGSVLLIGLTVLFASPTIDVTKNIFATLSIICGVIGIILVVLWHARERLIQINKKPILLLVASGLLGGQVVFLAFNVILPKF